VQERQRLQQCLKHTINNIAGRPAVSVAELNAIADGLISGRTPRLLHPHRTPFLGNYDVNVLECALRTLGLELTWHDQRDTAFSALDPAADRLVAVILNVACGGWWSRLLAARHWYALRTLRGGGAWYNLDSRLAAPRPVAALLAEEGGEALPEAAALRRYLSQQAERHQAQVFLVMRAIQPQPP
jgi:hypothetical protein